MSDILPEVYLARHGEAAWSLSGKATGRTDIALTHRGERDGAHHKPGAIVVGGNGWNPGQRRLKLASRSPLSTRVRV